MDSVHPSNVFRHHRLLHDDIRLHLVVNLRLGCKRIIGILRSNIWLAKVVADVELVEEGAILFLAGLLEHCAGWTENGIGTGVHTV